MFKRHHAEEFGQLREPASDEQVNRIVEVATNFRGALRSLPGDNSTRREIEKDQANDRRRREATARHFAARAHRIIN